MAYHRLPLGLLPILLLAACSSTTVSPGVSEGSAIASAPSSASSSAQPTVGTPAEPTSSAGAILGPDSVAAVVTSDLVVRSAPGTGGDSEVYSGVLDQPTTLFVVDGPVSASGYEWYLVYPFASSNHAGLADWRLGWVAAASKQGEPWIAAEGLECNPTPDLGFVLALGPFGSLACYRDRPLTLTGVYRGPDAVIPGLVEPAWLAGVGYHLYPLGTPPDEFVPGLFMHRNPDDLVFPNSFGYPIGTNIQVVGHFDDPAAQSCVARSSPVVGPEVPSPPAQTILVCRTEFVVTEVTEASP